MERTVPSTASEEIELYLRTYYSLLRTTSEVKIRTLEEAHAGMRSLLHPGARSAAPDMSAFIYSMLRLPEQMPRVRLVVMGQGPEDFLRAGFGDIEAWKLVSAPARRRRCYFDGQETMACFIASRSDIDDLIPLLTAYQIEWNKLHRLLSEMPDAISLAQVGADLQSRKALISHLQMAEEDFDKLATFWGEGLAGQLEAIAAIELRFRVQLLSGSLSEYRRATRIWWNNIEQASPEVRDRPLYFVSSNIHSLPNILTSFALKERDRLEAFLESSTDQLLKQEWRDIQNRLVPSSQENFFYYVLKKYLQLPEGQPLQRLMQEDELKCGIHRAPPGHSFDVEAQVIELRKLIPQRLDPRLQEGDLSFLAESDAVILNIDYPLGLAAYNIMSKIAEHNNQILGLYLMGKAATLNGVVGDVMISNVIHDEHTLNTYLFANCFTAADVNPYLVYGSVLDNQKAVTVLGTFLQNDHFMDVFYREGYTIIEMEAGAYLSAVYEIARPARHPTNELINLSGLPFDLGILHYASDTPLSKGKNLGAGSLSYFGVDPTYATALAIVRRILSIEKSRLRNADGIPTGKRQPL